MIIYIAKAEGDDFTGNELVTLDLSAALEKRQAVLEKECSFSIEVWENGVLIGDVYWDEDFEAYGGTSRIIDMIRIL